jgi:xanthine dehydrogenase D subunit
MSETVIDRPGTTTGNGVGSSAPRPDGPPKVQGSFAFSSDLYMKGMLWGKTLRSPHPSARIVSIDTSAAEAMPGVAAVLTWRDVPGNPNFGLGGRDQPVLAKDVVRYQGEPIAIVAADHPELALRAVNAIRVEYAVLEPMVDAEQARDAPALHPDGNVYRHVKVRRGDQDATGDVVVEGTYEIGMQDQAFMGPESGMAIPVDGGGVELFIATQDLHADLEQIAECLGLPQDQVLVTLAGVGGAFGAREDLSLQVHLCLLALRTNRPVKMVYSREESFFGHVHRHPARMWFRHHATRDGDLVRVEARVILDGGAYASTSAAVLGNATLFTAGPYRVPSVHLDGWAVRTNNPPCGAMRGFGTVQACFGAESQMDKLAQALGMDPVELRLRNAIQTGDTFVTGQVLDGTAPARECLEAAVALPMPPADGGDSPLSLPGGAGQTALPHNIRRGVGYALSFKNIMFPEGFDDFSTAAVRLERGFDGEPLATVTCAAAEVGQGFVAVAQQVVRTELGVEQVIVAPADTRIGPAGSSSASRQVYMSGGAIQRACWAVRDALFARAAGVYGTAGELSLRDGVVHGLSGEGVALRDLLTEPVYETREFHHRKTESLDENGQGDAHVAYAFAAHRAVVDVDVELGLVRVVQIATGQDVGLAINPLGVLGQIEGGIAQGVGLAVMEEIILQNGEVKNASFTDYLIPTTLDMPEVLVTLIEQPEPGAPFGAKGVGEPPVISSTPAVVAAIRAATGTWLERIPVRPQDVALASSP